MLTSKSLGASLTSSRSFPSGSQKHWAPSGLPLGSPVSPTLGPDALKAAALLLRATATSRCCQKAQNSSQVSVLQGTGTRRDPGGNSLPTYTCRNPRPRVWGGCSGSYATRGRQ